MTQPALQYHTEQEYLAFERASQEKHEVYKGEIFAMSGASFKHNIIQVNLIVLLGVHLSGKGCRPFGSNLRIHILLNSLYT
jgi:Uma2 family endonuclease